MLNCGSSSQEAANTAVEQLNGMLKYTTGMAFGDE